MFKWFELYSRWVPLKGALRILTRLLRISMNMDDFQPLSLNLKITSKWNLGG